MTQEDARTLCDKQHACVITRRENHATFARIWSCVTVHEKRTKSIIRALMNRKSIRASLGDEDSEAHCATHEFVRSIVRTTVAAVEHSHRSVMRNGSASFEFLLRTRERDEKATDAHRRRQRTSGARGIALANCTDRAMRFIESACVLLLRIAAVIRRCRENTIVHSERAEELAHQRVNRRVQHAFEKMLEHHETAARVTELRARLVDHSNCVVAEMRIAIE